MNIFVLSEDPREAARAQCDRHVVKMVLESAQILSSARHRYGAPAPYKATHAHHPCVLWAGECVENYRWVWEHLAGLLAEYTARYGKQHAVAAHLEGLKEPPPGMPVCGARTAFSQCMPEHYRQPDNPVQAYRNYYMGEKAGFARWRQGNPPTWYQPEIAAGARPATTGRASHEHPLRGPAPVS